MTPRRWPPGQEPAAQARPGALTPRRLLPGQVARWLRRRRPAVAPASGPDAGALPADRAVKPPVGVQRRRNAAQHPAFSPEAMQRAWRQVRANGGGPGVDGVDIASFEANLAEELGALRDELVRGSYRPRGVRRVLIPKRGEGLRPLAIWALRDRVAQRVVYEVLEPAFEPMFLPCSHGFRPQRSVATAVADVLAGRDGGLRWVLDADIKDCFENIDPGLLMRLVRRRVQDQTLLRLLESWLQANILTASGGVRPAGTAQGGVLSPLLCNVYLHEFDRALTGQGRQLVRYADDMLVLCRRRREAEEAEAAAGHALGQLRLEVNPHKTQIVHFDQGFKFLGVFFLRNEHFML